MSVEQLVFAVKRFQKSIFFSGCEAYFRRQYDFERHNEISDLNTIGLHWLRHSEVLDQ